MGILSSIFGGGDVIKAGFDLIDNMHTTEVELTEAQTKAKTDMLSAYAPFKIAQRYLALIFTVTYVSSFIMSMYFGLTGNPSGEIVTKIMEQYHIGWITLTIVGFYFGGGAFEGIAGKLKKK